MKTKCSIKIKKEDKFTQPTGFLRTRQQSQGLAKFMDPIEIKDAT